MQDGRERRAPLRAEHDEFRIHCRRELGDRVWHTVCRRSDNAELGFDATCAD
jgi:hypothetical protein